MKDCDRAEYTYHYIIKDALIQEGVHRHRGVRGWERRGRRCCHCCWRMVGVGYDRR